MCVLNQILNSERYADVFGVIMKKIICQKSKRDVFVSNLGLRFLIDDKEDC